MSNFIEINSTYRNRNLWPIAGQFEIPINGSGTKTKYDAFDPVSLAEPLVYWTIDYLANVSPKVISFILSVTPIAEIRNNYAIALQTNGVIPQQKDNYFAGLCIVSNNGFRTRILSSKYLGYTTQGLTDRYQYLFELINSFDASGGTTFTIEDPSSNVDPNYPLVFVPNGNNQDNSYSNYYLYNENNNTYGLITFYDSVIKIISAQPNTFPAGSISGINVCIRKELPLIPVKNGANFTPSVSSTKEKIIITYNSVFSKENNFYKNDFIRLKPPLGTEYYNGTISESRIITKYEYDGTNSIFYVNNPFTITPSDYNIEILPFSYDNFNPLTYTGTLVQQASCYEFELVNLILPNQILSVGNGSKIAFYPFVYVEISNVSSSSSHLLHTIYSNNPNATKMVFRVPIYDVQDPDTTPFVRLLDCNMMQTIKLKPDDNLLFSVRLSNGDIYNTIIPESYSPSVPNSNLQISALFRYRRVI
jgi:hypothetical protein